MEKKIAVASDDGIYITGHVGRCEMFIIFDTKEDKIMNIEKRVNNFTNHRLGGHHAHEHRGKHHRIIEGLKDCSVLICSGAGPGLINDLENNGINVILTAETLAERAVELYLQGELLNDTSRSCSGDKHY